ncbi:MAG: MmgE/PrpD family protein [Thermomicrobiales bacterium]|nr:MmgE/PrpD family protein [Thermomicrobiales bacterium]MCO5221554.1 MmgE/PrpD family protein [Thermomicrobiales bacterium]
MGETQLLAEFALDIALETPPLHVRNAAAACLLDSVGCALGGTGTWLGQQMIAFALEQGGHPHATVIGAGDAKLPPMTAALVNGQLSNALDFDDTYLDLGHTGTAVVPAAMAIAERMDASGAELRAAIIAGYEVANRVGFAARPSDERYRVLYPVGWHSFGAAAAAGRLLRLTPRQMECAFGITLEHMQVATTITSETVHGFKAGKLGQASALGIMAALLAAKGFEGKRKALDADGAFWLAMGSDRVDGSRLTEGLGTRWTIDEMSFKPFPSCRMTHPALQAAAVVKARYRLAPTDIRSIQVRTFSRMLQLTAPEPLSSEAIPFSLPSTMGMLLRGIDGGAQWADVAVACHPETVSLARRIEVIGEERFDRRVDETGTLPAEVVFELADGQVVSHTELDAPWSAQSSVSTEELMPKFLGMAVPALGDQAHDLADALRSLALEDPLSTRRITDLLHPHTVRARMA